MWHNPCALAWKSHSVTFYRRALSLYEADRTLTIALDVARAFCPATEYMMRLWPGPGLYKFYHVRSAKLTSNLAQRNGGSMSRFERESSKRVSPRVYLLPNAWLLSGHQA